MKSMTGFGSAELNFKQDILRAEIKTVNHKFLEISIRLPQFLNEFEEAIRKIVTAAIHRGKVYLSITSPELSAISSKLVLNEALAQEVSHKIQELRRILKLGKKNRPGALCETTLLKEVLHYPDVLKKDVSYSQKKLFFRDLKKVVLLALESLKKSRDQEGVALSGDLLNRNAELERALKGIEKRVPVIAQAFKKKLGEQAKNFLEKNEINADRLTQEVALYVKNEDISEEITRFWSHTAALKKAIQEGSGVGRKIDFIAQEMIREANTMGAKSSDTKLSDCVIQLKSSIEKIREQSQNVE